MDKLLTTINTVKLSILALALTLSSFVFADQSQEESPKSNNQITLVETATTFRYNTPPRLSMVLAEALHTLTYNPYYLGAALVDETQQQDFMRFKQNVMDQLAMAKTFSTEKMRSQLQHTAFTKKETLSLDYDIVRVFPKKNPLLKGHFKLYLPKRPHDIMVYGAIQSTTPINLALQDGSSLQAYLPEIPFYNVAMNTTIWIIEPDQTIDQIQNIHQQKQPTYLAPGAIIYIASNEIPEQLNQNIVTLLQNRLEK
ncbi:hypothetical protein MSP8887_02481 [Marinomonas spartinae]|uniref:capsule biosynthesis GfcC D2 domain-containing protein n=1 Tax=Marinomonas spartinae TaxID=1792290 RepID=UPI000808BE0C|nr:capsule biosynthesis GfcC D2 domain-containing protein [Marinomonas spartinae]SBS35897.1 hypothetical protein MSP8887_02481 [Marinomonas spartinae]